MTRTLLLDRTPLRIRAALLEDDVVTRLIEELPSRQTPMRTSLYRVRVTSIDRRMNAAFCDMGNGQSGFLRREGKLPPEGTTLIAEVRREGVGQKGPDLTDKAIIRTPFATMRLGGEPRKGLFHSSSEDADLTQIACLANQMGLDGALGSVDPRTDELRIVLGLAEAGLDEVVVTTGETAAELSGALQGAVNISLVDKKEARHALDEAEHDALMRSVPLAGGGRMIIDQAEALTAIDLDLGRQGGQSQKGAGRNMLAEALTVLGRYALLAKLGGQIVIDVPRGAVTSPKILRDQLTKALRPLGRVSVPAVTPEGVCVVIASKPEPSLLDRLTVETVCGVRAGRRYADDVIAARAYEAVEACLGENRTGIAHLIVHPVIGEFFAKSNKAYQCLTSMYGPRFSVTMDPERDIETVDVTI